METDSVNRHDVKRDTWYNALSSDSLVEEEAQMKDRMFREAAIAMSLQIDLKAEKRVNDELKKEMHELRLNIVALETRNRTLRQEEESMCRKLGEMQDAKKLLEEERVQLLHRTREQVEALEVQLRAAKDREHEHGLDRERMTRDYQAAMSVRNEEAERQRRAHAEAEARNENLLQELGSLRQQALLQRAREQELEETLRTARREMDHLYSTVKEKDVASSRYIETVERVKIDHTVERVKTEALEETVMKLRKELKGALQAKEGLQEERETLLDAYEVLQAKTVALRDRDTELERELKDAQEKLAHALQQADSLARLRADKARLQTDKDVLLASVAQMNAKLAEAEQQGVQWERERERERLSQDAHLATQQLLEEARARRVELELRLKATDEQGRRSEASLAAALRQIGRLTEELSGVRSAVDSLRAGVQEEAEAQKSRDKEVRRLSARERELDEKVDRLKSALEAKELSGLDSLPPLPPSLPHPPPPLPPSSCLLA
jgi:chromosome segregation ATPase